MRIAERFASVGEALSFVGERTLGMPLVDYVFRPARHVGREGLAAWADSIGQCLFVTHLVASLCGAWLVRQRRWLTSRTAERALFVFVASFPAIIGHTTTPLTDALSVDVTLFALVSLAVTRVPFGVLAGALAAFAVLLRPSYAVPTVGAAAVLVALAWQKRQTLPITPVLAAAFVLALVLGTVGLRCRNRYGTLCLQDPKTFEPVRHAQMGLRGARLLWYGPYPSNGEFPVLPDAVMAPRLYVPCKLESLAGTTDASLSGCLLRRPHLVPVYAVKKWIGLFDHFRFTPFVERETPTWLRWLSRAYDAIAVAGFFYAVWSTVSASRRLRSIAVDPPALAYGTFLTLMLGEHTLLHVEDRFGLVLVPACALFAARLVERVAHEDERRKAAPLVVGALAAVVVFVVQIVIWDGSGF